jgi:hypothetical protein
MALIDQFFSRKKSLSQLDRQELRREEILLLKQRDKLFKRIEEVTGQKQKIFEQGARQKSPELRKALAMEFELKTQEQVLVAKELSLRSKELLTVSRLRMIKENQGRGRALGRLNLTDKDVAKMSQWIEDDTVTQDVYQERLDMLLEQGQQADKESLGRTGLSTAGQELMDVWGRLDRGAIKSQEAFEQADRAARRRAGEGTPQ